MKKLVALFLAVMLIVPAFAMADDVIKSASMSRLPVPTAPAANRKPWVCSMPTLRLPL